MADVFPSLPPPSSSLLPPLTSDIRHKIEDLRIDYPTWRRVRGDGNCYYRAVMFGLLERCVKDPERRKWLINLVDGQRFEGEEEEEGEGGY